MIEASDRLDFLRKQPDDSIDLVFFSPPYEDCRTYGINFALKGQAWVDFMVETWKECNRVCKGLVAGVLQGRTRNYKWSAVPALLIADLHRSGMNLRNPPIFHRVGIPGSGGPDWLRADYEWIVCTSKSGKLPWSDNTAAGHPPKWAPGGEMSHRTLYGERVNATKPTMTEIILAKRGNRRRTGDGKREPMIRKGTATKGHKNGDTTTEINGYDPPVMANPGNVISMIVGGGVMGDPLCHENEAPFPESLAEFFIRSFCPPAGLVCDPFMGSGTTLAVALRCNRRAIGCDIRESQVELTQRRLATVQRELPWEGP